MRKLNSKKDWFLEVLGKEIKNYFEIVSSIPFGLGQESANYDHWAKSDLLAISVNNFIGIEPCPGFCVTVCDCFGAIVGRAEELHARLCLSKLYNIYCPSFHRNLLIPDKRRLRSIFQFYLEGCFRKARRLSFEWK